MSAPVSEVLALDELESFLDDHGLGHGPVSATPIGDGASNLTYLIERGGARVVLRRPPPPPLPPSAHDVVREARLVGILDWEMATIGDPLADLGYLVVSWSERGADPHPLLLTPVTQRPGFPARAELIARYAERTGRDTSALDWYQAFALWKAAVFCEAIYKRFLRGERADERSASLCDGVPRLLEVAIGYL